MSFIQNLFSSRDNNADGNTFVGQQDRLWWNPDTNAFYVNTANVAGGTPVTLPATANLTINSVTANTATINNNLIVTGNISPAANNKIGGIAPGPGVTVDSNGILLIDTAGLPFSFGDFTGLVGTYPSDYPDPARANQDYAILSSVNSNEDIVIASNGTGAVRVVGDFSVRRANGNITGALEEEPIFRVRSDGQVQMLVPSADAIEGAFTIVGGLDGVFQAPVNTGVMLHITGIAGDPAVPSRIYNDAQNSFSAIVSRRYNGTAAAPTAVLNGQEIMRFSGTAHNGTEIPGVANQRIVYKALGDQTPSNQGGTMEFLATPLNSTTLTLVATIDNANGVTATKFTTAGTVSATGNITGGNVTTAGIASTGSLTASTTISATGNITGGNILTGGAVSATGGITSGDGISDSKGDVRSIPLNTQNTGYTLVATDAGKLINMTTGNVTVPASVFAAPFGQAITIYNNQNSSNAIVQGSGVTLRLAGTAATGNRTLSRYSLATLVCVSANTFVISGAGLT